MRTFLFRVALGAALLAPLSGCGGDDDGDPADMGRADEDGQPSLGDAEGDAAPVTDAGEDAGPTDDAEVADGGPRPACPEGSPYGQIAFPLQASMGSVARHTPRVASSGSELGAVWFAAPEMGEIGSIVFQRFSLQGAPLGEVLTLGPANSPKLEVVYTGAGFAVVWQSVRNAEATGFAGVRLQMVSATGEASGGPVDIAAAFDVDRLAAAWAQLGGGMVLYTLGRNGSGGLFAVPIDEGGNASPGVRLSETAALSPAVAFGDGKWGVAWMAPGTENPNDIHFRLLDERGAPTLSPEPMTDVGAQGGLHLAYGQDTYGIGYSVVDGMGKLKPRLTLVQGDGQTLATPEVGGPSGFGLVTDVSWLDPEFFGVAWQDNDGASIRVGLTRVNVRGQVLDPVPVEVAAPAQATHLAVAGTVSNVAGLYTVDPAPGQTGFSAGTQVWLTRIGPCRR